MIVASGGCFYGADQVSLVGGGRRSIEDLRAGDRVWSMSVDGLKWIEDEIVMMMDTGHNQSSEPHSLVEVTVEE
jgi:hypothetical protein